MNQHGGINKLTQEEERVIIRKDAERAFTGEYADNKESGTYMLALQHVFVSFWGWPGFGN